MSRSIRWIGKYISTMSDCLTLPLSDIRNQTEGIMAYSELPLEDLILMAAEFVGRGHSIPQEIRATLGPDLMADIENPEITNDRPQERVRPRYKRRWR